MAQSVSGSITQTNSTTIGGGTSAATNQMNLGSIGGSVGASLGTGASVSSSGGSVAAHSISAGMNQTTAGKNLSVAENTGTIVQSNWQSANSLGSAGAISGTVNGGTLVGAGAAQGGYLTVITETTIAAGITVAP